MGKISNRSREFCQYALDTLNSILEKYPTIPDIHIMNEEARYWIKGKMNEFGNAIAGAKYKGFSFYTIAVKNIRNPNSHTVKEDKQLLETTVREFYSIAINAKTKLKKDIGLTYSQNKKVRQFEKFSAFGSEEERKLFVDSLQNELFD